MADEFRIKPGAGKPIDTTGCDIQPDGLGESLFDFVDTKGKRHRFRLTNEAIGVIIDRLQKHAAEAPVWRGGTPLAFASGSAPPIRWFGLPPEAAAAHFRWGWIPAQRRIALELNPPGGPSTYIADSVETFRGIAQQILQMVQMIEGLPEGKA